jgi:predicted transposase/invertase (TIGR01784 family)
MTSLEATGNPHDKLFREVFQDKDAARDFLVNYLPADVLSVMDMNTIEISKDSFIADDLKEFYSDLLYTVQVAGEAGFVYILFEHKSYKDEPAPLQLLEYMVRIWRLHLKQNQSKGLPLPIILPILLYHGKETWRSDPRFLSLFFCPVEAMRRFIPDFDLVFFDLARYQDKEIKGTILTRVALLLFKHIFDMDIKDRLPEIFSLLEAILKEKSGMKILEILLRYLFSAIDDITVLDIKTMVETSLTGVKGDSVMTLAEQLRNEGFQQGEISGLLKGKLEGMLEGIEMAVYLKFGAGPESQNLVVAIRRINDLDTIKRVKMALMEAKAISDIYRVLS